MAGQHPLDAKSMVKRLHNLPTNPLRTACTAVLASAFIGTGTPSEVRAEACALFKWPITLERNWLAASDLTTYDSGSSLTTFPDGGLKIELLPAPHVGFVVTPERLTPSGWGGVLFFPTPELTGIYQITLTDSAWIEVVQSGIRLTPRAHTGNKDCLGIRKSIQFELGSGEVALQISGSTTPVLRVGVRRISEKPDSD